VYHIQRVKPRGTTHLAPGPPAWGFSWRALSAYYIRSVCAFGRCGRRVNSSLNWRSTPLEKGRPEPQKVSKSRKPQVHPRTLDLQYKPIEIQHLQF